MLNTLALHLELLSYGSSIYDVTAVKGGGGQRFCDDSTKALVIKIIKNYPKLHDIIFGRTHNRLDVD